MRALGSWRGLPLALGVASLLGTSPILAQSAEANLLFDEARAAMARHDYAQAILELQQSQALDPSAGTLLNLAECYVAVGRTASAWSTYRDAASLANVRKDPKREQYAARRARELEPELSRLRILIAPDARVPGLTIWREGVALPESLWGSPIPVDPGAQRVEAKAPGFAAWSQEAQVPSGPGQTQVEVPALVAESPPAAAAAPVASAPAAVAVAPAAAAPAAAPPADSRSASAPSPLPTIGWSALGAGAVAAGVGVVVYLNGRAKIDDANCPDQICVRGVGNKRLHEDGRSGERLGVELALVGAAAMGAGVVLLLVAPPRKADARLELRLNVGASGLNLRGAW